MEEKTHLALYDDGHAERVEPRPNLDTTYAEFRSALERQQPGFGWVYLISERGSNLCKIGYSVDPERRLKEIQKKSPLNLEIGYGFGSNNAREAEEYIHSWLKRENLHVAGEWFLLPDWASYVFCQLSYIEWRGM